MSQSPEDLPRPLRFARAHERDDPRVREFLQACKDNCVATATHLIPNDADVLTNGLNRAIQGGHIDLARHLIEKGATWDSWTAICAASSLEAVEMLVQSGFHVNTTLTGGGTLLCLVVSRNNEAGIRFLLKHGADPNLGPPKFLESDVSKARALPNSGRTLNCAARSCTTETFALLSSYGALSINAIPLHFAAGYGRSPPYTDTINNVSRVPMLEYLVELGFDINALDEEGEIDRRQIGTPLHYAVKFRCVEEAKWLLEHGADPDKPDNNGISARDRARRCPEGHEIRTLLCPFE